MSRGHQKASSIIESMESDDDLQVDIALAEQELRNWGSWIRSIKSPIPLKSAQGIIMFRELKPQYPDEPRLRIEPDMDRAEVCEAIICAYQQLPLVCFYATFVLQMTHHRSAELINLWNQKTRLRNGHGKGKNRFNNISYAATLKGSMMILQQDLMEQIQLVENK